MAGQWHATSALIGLPGMPKRCARAIRTRGKRCGWVSRRTGGRLEWLQSSLPLETQGALASAGASLPAELDGLPRLDQKSEAAADARLEVLNALKRWLEAEKPPDLNDGLHGFAERYTAARIEVSPETRALIPSLSRASLIRWRRALREGGWSALAPSRRGRQRSLDIEASCEFGGAVGAFILKYPHGSAPACRRWLINEHGAEPTLSASTVRRWMARWRQENPNVLLAETDPDRYRSHRAPAIGDAAAGIVRLSQLWELDSSPADVICTDGRHALIGGVDVYSRRARVLVRPTSRAIEIAALLRCMLLDWGVPEIVRTDEGKDYISRHVSRIFADLDIEPDVLPPYSPEMKPFIERFFGTLARGLLAYLPGFAGHNVAQRQAIRARQSFAARRGESEADAFQVELTAAELQERIDAWVETVYEREPHSGLNGRTPFEVAAGQPVRRIENERALDILLAPPPDGRNFRKVLKGAIKVDGGTYFAAELAPFSGLNVEVRLDPADLGVVYVMAGDVIPRGLDVSPGAFVCRAEDAARLGTRRAEVAARAKALARAADKAGREHARALKSRYRPDRFMVDGVLGPARRDADRLVAFPATGTAHESPGLGEAAKAATGGAKPTDDHEFFVKYGQLYGDRFRRASGGQ